MDNPKPSADAKQSAGYDSDPPSSSILSKPSNNEKNEKSNSPKSPDESQPTPENTGNSLPPSIQQSTDSKPSYGPTTQTKPKRPTGNHKPRAWKISQGQLK